MSFFYVLTCITILSSNYPLHAMHSLLVTSDVRNIQIWRYNLLTTLKVLPALHGG